MIAPFTHNPPTQGSIFPNASLQKFILAENKKYIVAIFNILDANIKYGDENNLLHRSVERFSAKQYGFFTSEQIVLYQ